jgi:hypothetical protein
MMDGFIDDAAPLVTGDLLDAPPPPPRLYERLRQIAGYSWDESRYPQHLSYDFWYVGLNRHALSIFFSPWRTC